MTSPEILIPEEEIIYEKGREPTSAKLIAGIESGIGQINPNETPFPGSHLILQLEWAIKRLGLKSETESDLLSQLSAESKRCGEQFSRLWDLGDQAFEKGQTKVNPMQNIENVSGVRGLIIQMKSFLERWVRTLKEKSDELEK